MFLPSVTGALSIVAFPSIRSKNRRMTSTPIAECAICLPRMRMDTFTLFPSVRNSIAFFALTFRSPTSMVMER